MMRNLLFLVGIAVVTYGITLYFSQRDFVPRVPIDDAVKIELDGQSVPEFSFTDLAGQTHQISDFAGKIVILNFWASWCTPCIKEFPLLIAATTAHPDDVVLVALSSDIEATAIEAFIQKMDALNFDAPNILLSWDENQTVTAGVFQTFKLPETIIIAPNQQMVHKFVGANWTAVDLEAQIARLKP